MNGWSFGGSILTFAFPMLLFVVVAVALYILYTKPASVPGRRSSAIREHPVSYTPIAGVRPDPGVPDQPEPGPDNPADYDATSYHAEMATDGDTAPDGDTAAPEAGE